MGGLKLSLLGTFQAVVQGRPLQTFRTRKVPALLIYLAVEKTMGEIRRESLMELLWPGLPQKSAQVNLRQIIYQLRKAVPPVSDPSVKQPVEILVSDRQIVKLNPAYPLSVDVDTLEHLLKETWNHNHLDLLVCQECRDRLEDAAAIYRGDFLEDFYIEDSNEFEDWAVIKREQLRRSGLDAMDSLAEIHLHRRDYILARNLAERQLEIDPLRETACRQLMLSLALSGQRSEAMGEYEKFRRRLSEELGMDTSARTTELYTQILSGEMKLGEDPAVNVHGYELKEKIGAGTFGTVYRAYQTSIGREVAVKIIRADFANDPTFIRRFEAEAQTIARLEHPFIVPLYDFWREPDRAFLCMRLFRNGSLKASLQAGPWSLEKTARLVGQLAAALEAAHRRGVVHRDIKPANILLDESDNAYLSDFGIAFDPPVSQGRAGHVLSPISPEYASPEQHLSEPVTPQTDIYCLGLVIYEALTGRSPFEGPAGHGPQKYSPERKLPLVAPNRPEVPAELDAVLQRTTAFNPEDRYPDLLSFASDFSRAIRKVASEVESAIHPLGWDAAGENPYKGLRPFMEEDASEFFGRDDLATKLLERLSQDRFLAVVGPSGSGKSSVVSAGLIPRLRAGHLEGSETWFIARMTPGAHPLEALESALLPIAVHPPPSLVEPMLKDTRGILRTLRRVLPEDGKAELLLVIDQFEELYTLTADTRLRTHFIDSLLAALDEPDSPLRVVVTLRADFYDRPLTHLLLGERLQSGTEVVLSLSPEELEQAVRGPASKARAVLENGLMTAISTDFNNQPGALPLLQYSLTELFEARQGSVLTRARYNEIGGLTGALGRRAEGLFASLDPDEQEIARQIFLRLVALGEDVDITRRRTLVSELESLVQAEGESGDRAAESTHRILDLFGRHRLLTFDRDPVTRGPTVEVAHEALLDRWERLRGLLSEHRSDIRKERTLAASAAEWIAAERHVGYLLRGARLDEFERWAGDCSVALTNEEREFLDESLAARRVRETAEEMRAERERQLAERSSRIQRVLIGVFATAALVTGFLSVYAFNQQELAQAEAMRRATQQAIAEENAAEALAQKNLADIEAASRATQQAIAEEQRQFAQEQADVAASQQAMAEEQARLATARELANAGLLTLDVEPELSMLLTLRSLELSPTTQGESVLRQALFAQRVQNTILGSVSNGGTIGISPDGQRVVTGGVGGIVQVWDAVSGEELLRLNGHTAGVGRAFYTADGRYLGTTSLDNTIRLWDAESGEALLTLDGHSNWIFALDFTQDSTRMATASYDGDVKIWDLRTGMELLSFQGDDDFVYDVAYSPDGEWLATAGWNSARIWEAATGREILALDIQDVPDIAFNPNGTQLVTNSGPGTITLWDVSEPGSDSFGQEIFSDPEGYPESFSTTLAFMNGGDRLVILGADHKIKVVDTATGDELDRFACHPGGFEMALDPENKQVAVVGGTGLTKICSLEPPPEWYAFSNGVHDVNFTVDGAGLITSARSDGLEMWDFTGGNPSKDHRKIRSIGGDGGEFFSTLLSSDGSIFAAVKRNENAIFSVDVWQTDTWKFQWEITPQNNKWYFPDLSMYADGSLLAFVNENGANIWDLSSGEELLVLDGDEQWGLCLDFSRDGRYLITCESDSFWIWDVASGKEVLIVKHPSRVLRMSPDGNVLVTGGLDGTVTLWDFRSFQEKGQLPELAQLSAHTGSILRAEFSNDGSLLATSGKDLKIIIWDIEREKQLFEIEGHEGEVWGLAFSPDGKWLASASYDQTMRLHLVNLEDLIDLAYKRLTRWWTEDECQTYLHQEACPPPPEGFQTH